MPPPSLSRQYKSVDFINVNYVLEINHQYMYVY